MSYWTDRQKQLNRQMEKDEAALRKRLSSFYDTEGRRLEKEIALYYQKFGEDNVVEYRKMKESLSDADRKLLMEQMETFAEKYPEYEYLMPVRESIYKLDRLEGLQYSVKMQMLEIGAVNNKEIEKHLEKQALRGTNAAAEVLGFGKNFYFNNPDITKRFVNAAWAEGKNFSQRIWENTEKLANYLNTDIAQGFARGDSYERMVKSLRSRFDHVSQRDAYRLIYTEGTYVMAESTIQLFIEDFEEYRISTVGDGKVCPICRGLATETFRIKDRQPGVSFPPLHSWCRCTYTIEVKDWNKWMKDYERRHKNGQAEKVAGRLKDDRNNGKINLGSLGNDISKGYLGEIEKRLSVAPRFIQDAWNWCVGEFRILSTDFRGTANYDPIRRGININMDGLSQDRFFDIGRGREIYKKAYGTLFHELGHNMSSLASRGKGRMLWEDYADVFESRKYMKTVNSENGSEGIGYTLTEMLKKEGSEYIKTVWDQMKEEAVKNGGKRSDVKKREAYAKISREIKELPLISSGDISDMWEGITNGSVSGYVGHKGANKSYWKHVTVGTEGFAEMTDATINNPESLEQIKKYFPKSYEIYLEMIEDIGKGV